MAASYQIRNGRFAGIRNHRLFQGNQIGLSGVWEMAVDQPWSSGGLAEKIWPWQNACCRSFSRGDRPSGELASAGAESQAPWTVVFRASDKPRVVASSEGMLDCHHWLTTVIRQAKSAVAGRQSFNRTYFSCPERLASGQSGQELKTSERLSGPESHPSTRQKTS